ncbi:MAG TPA: YciI family protein [Burkholderiaceae bacterium]|nr:YciI family protein [Burkholderiaceae bacterium]
MSSYFVVFGTDRPGMAEVRARVRAQHREHLRRPSMHPVHVRLGGPTLARGTEAMNGTLLVIEADSIEDVERFLNDDPYLRSGLFESIEIRQWIWGLGNPDARV